MKKITLWLLLLVSVAIACSGIFPTPISKGIETTDLIYSPQAAGNYT